MHKSSKHQTIENYIFSRLLHNFLGSNLKLQHHFAHGYLVRIPWDLKKYIKKKILIFVLYYYSNDKYKSILDHHLAEYRWNGMKVGGQFLGQ